VQLCSREQSNFVGADLCVRPRGEEAVANNRDQAKLVHGVQSVPNQSPASSPSPISPRGRASFPMVPKVPTVQAMRPCLMSRESSPQRRANRANQSMKSNPSPVSNSSPAGVPPMQEYLQFAEAISDEIRVIAD